MLKRILSFKLVSVVLLMLTLFCSGAFAMADRRVINEGDNRRDNRGDNRRDNRDERNYYHDGRWYKHDSRGNEISVADIVIGAIAVSLPPQHTTIVVQGAPYYYDNSHYYRQLPDGGFIVVQPPRRDQYDNNRHGH